MPEIVIPYRFRPRPYQLGPFQAYERGIRRIGCCWHRRSGKDKTFWNFMVQRAVERVANYWYTFPTYRQAKKALWKQRDRSGFPMLGHIPPDLLHGKPNESDLSLELWNGSMIQLIGTEHLDNLMGAGPAGIVFSEYSLQNPSVLDYVEPMLLENDGWALFNGTPRGENHFYDLLEETRDDPEWYWSVQTVEDTGALPLSYIDKLRRRGMSEELILQEYYVDFQAANEGTYYGRLMKQARLDGRIGAVPFLPGCPVHTSWDLGISDEMVIWFWQEAGGQRRYIDYYANDGFGLDHYADVLQKRSEELGYVYGKHWAPHDIKVREIGNKGKSRWESARLLGITFEICPDHEVADGIEQVRKTLPACAFDAVRCKAGINALKSYGREWDDKRKTYRNQPCHNWASHPADSFRYGVMATGKRQLKWS